MSDKSNKYGYVGVDIPAQSFGANKGVFNPAEINELVADNKWTTFGQLELIETQTHSSDISTIDFTSIQESTYNVHLLTVQNLTSGAGSQEIKFRFYESGVLETASVYEYAMQSGLVGGAFGEVKSTADDGLFINNTSVIGFVQNFYVYFYNLGDSSKYSFTTSHSMHYRSNGDHQTLFGSGVLPQTSTVDGIRIFNTTKNFLSYDISLYGIRYS